MTQMDYTPPKIWEWTDEMAAKTGGFNRPTSEPLQEKSLPVGKHPLQLYSMGTPNGVKVAILLEELLALGFDQAEYDAWLINIAMGDQFSSGFIELNPNGKIPALVDRSGETPVTVFESGAILLYLAEKFAAFIPIESAKRAQCLSWLFWQMSSAPLLGGGWVRPFLCLCQGEAGISHQPLHH